MFRRAGDRKRERADKPGCGTLLRGLGLAQSLAERRGTALGHTREGRCQAALVVGQRLAGLEGEEGISPIRNVRKRWWLDAAPLPIN